MNYALIDSSSLKNPTILNKYEHLKVTIQFEPNSSTSKYHHNFLLQFSDNVVDQAIIDIQKEMLESWYSFFWNDKVLNIVFDKQKFIINLPDGWSSSQMKQAQEFGRLQGVSDEYLDFKVYFKPFDDLVRVLIK
jgi:hypothetical protein